MEPQGRRPRVSLLAADVAPLLDRCGRLIADLAPHVLALSREDATNAGTTGGSDSMAASSSPLPATAATASESLQTAMHGEGAASAPGLPPRGFRR